MTREEAIAELQRMFLEGKKKKLIFNRHDWRGLEEKRNCFMYALNLRHGNTDKDWLHILETLLDETITGDIYVEDAYLMELGLLKLIGVEFTECEFESPVPIGAYKVAILFSDEDVHWMRQDDDGTWSHKRGWIGKPERRDRRGRRIYNPQQAHVSIIGELFEIKYLLISR